MFIAAVGGLISMAKVGLPEPDVLWLAYVTSELVLSEILVVGQYATRRQNA